MQVHKDVTRRDRKRHLCLEEGLDGCGTGASELSCV